MVNINKLVKDVISPLQLNEVVITVGVVKRNVQKELTKEFIMFCLERLNIKHLPRIFFTKDKSKTKTLGHNNVTDNEITIFVKNRLMGDIFRTLAHELIHTSQNDDGLITYNSGDTGSEIENEANSKSAIFIREFGKLHPEIYELPFDGNMIHESYEEESREKYFQKTKRDGGNISKYNDLLKSDRKIYEVEDVGYRTGHIEGSKPEDMQRMNSNRNTGHFGTGYYFFGDKNVADDYSKTSGNRSIRIVDFSKYRLFKIRDENFGMKIHDFFKKLNNNDHFFNSKQKVFKNFLSSRDVRQYFREKDIELDYWKLLSLLESPDEFETYFYTGDKNECISSVIKSGFLKEDIDLINKVMFYVDNVVKSQYKQDLYSTYVQKIVPILSIFNNSKDLSENQIKDVSKIVLSDYKIKRGDSNNMAGKDTLSTRILKYFGYEGIDVRGVKGLDNSTYGSVIFDIKTDSIIQESVKPTHKREFGCLMFEVPFKNWNKILESIDPNDLYTEEGDDGYGLEKDSHVTVLYGLHDTVDEKELIEWVKEFSKGVHYNMIIPKMGVFKNSKFEVLKLDVESTPLKFFNEKLCENFEYTSKFPEYTPHITVAYLKKGTSDKYLKKFSKPIKKVVETLIYSKVDGTKTKFKYY